MVDYLRAPGVVFQNRFPKGLKLTKPFQKVKIHSDTLAKKKKKTLCDASGKPEDDSSTPGHFWLFFFFFNNFICMHFFTSLLAVPIKFNICHYPPNHPLLFSANIRSALFSAVLLRLIPGSGGVRRPVNNGARRAAPPRNARLPWIRSTLLALSAKRGEVQVMD